MLSKKSQEALLKALKVPDAEIQTLLAEEEKEFAIPATISILDEEGKAELLTNHGNSNKTAMREIMIKDMKELAGLEFDGKTPEKFIEALKEATLKEANVSVDEKVKAANTKVEELRTKLTEREKEVATFKESATKAQQQAKLLKHFPKDRNSSLTDEDYLTLLNSKAQILEDEGKEVFVFNGKKYQDDKLNPLPLNEAIPLAFKDSNWIAAATDETKTGTGFGDTKRVPGAVNNLREAKDHAKSQGWELTGQQFQTYLADQAQKNPNFSFNEA